MGYYTKIEASLDVSRLCVVDAAGKVAKEARVASDPEAFLAWFASPGLDIEMIGLVWRSKLRTPKWDIRGADAEEIAVDTSTGKTVTRINAQFHCPAKAKLGREPKTALEELCRMMVAAGLRYSQLDVSF